VLAIPLGHTVRTRSDIAGWSLTYWFRTRSDLRAAGVWHDYLQSLIFPIRRWKWGNCDGYSYLW
jgi:hypothetical protein